MLTQQRKAPYALHSGQRPLKTLADVPPGMRVKNCYVILEDGCMVNQQAPWDLAKSYLVLAAQLLYMYPTGCSYQCMYRPFMSSQPLYLDPKSRLKITLNHRLKGHYSTYFGGPGNSHPCKIALEVSLALERSSDTLRG